MSRRFDNVYLLRAELQRRLPRQPLPAIEEMADRIARRGMPVYSHREAEDACPAGCFSGWYDAECHLSPAAVLPEGDGT